MAHVFEHALSGRSKCRGCGEALAKGALRFGERLPNPFGDGAVTLWFHPACAAYKRPESLVAALGEAQVEIPDRDKLERTARASLEQRRLPRVDGAERAPTGQAMCRHCREPIARGTWRIRLVFFEEGRFSPGGFLHLACARPYCEGHEVTERVLHFSAALTEDEREEVRSALAG